MSNNNKPGMNQQDHPHREGQQNNTTPQIDERIGEANNTQQLSDMGTDGNNRVPERERNVEQEQRQP